MPLEAKGDEDRFVALVSGFSMGGDTMGSNNIMLRIQMMLDYCSGILGTEPEQRMASRITRVIFAGGMLKGTAKLSQPTSYASVREQATALEPMHDADALLSELCEHVDLDIMPGVADPTNYSLPQQPFHRCLLPQTTSLSSLTRCTNPHAFEIDSVQFLGTSGQNVDDVSRYSTFESPTEILGQMLQWRHIIPTAPDSLATYPYSDEDPFILDQTPHVFFAGGQASYQSTLLEGPDGQKSRIISVPEFALDPVMVLVNLRTLDVHPIRFDAFI
jgi:DNA polymerase delta subunit 2